MFTLRFQLRSQVPRLAKGSRLDGSRGAEESWVSSGRPPQFRCVVLGMA